MPEFYDAELHAKISLLKFFKIELWLRNLYANLKF